MLEISKYLKINCVFALVLVCAACGLEPHTSNTTSRRASITMHTDWVISGNISLEEMVMLKNILSTEDYIWQDSPGETESVKDKTRSIIYNGIKYIFQITSEFSESNEKRGESGKTPRKNKTKIREISVIEVLNLYPTSKEY